MAIPELYLILLWGLIAFIISKATIPVLLLVAKKKRLFDVGDDFRKMHDGLIPTLGGVAIFMSFIISFSASSYAEEIVGFGYFISAAFILFLAGLKDDIIVISPTKKLAAQLLATALIVFGSDMQFTSLGGVFGVDSISPWFGIPLTFFTVIVVINAYNLIDGIDGLGASFGVFVTSFFGYWFFLAELYAYAMLSFVLVGSILGFLWYNRPPAKIFMGDTGSLMIGFFISVLAINFVEYSATMPNIVFWQPAAPIIVAAVMAVPLYDTLRVFIVRAIRGKSPFEADKDHIHHHFLYIGLSHGQVVIVLLTLNTVILTTVAFASLYLSNTMLLVLLLGFCALIFPTNNLKRRALDSLIPNRWKLHNNLKEEDSTVEETHSPEYSLDSIDSEEEMESVKEKKVLEEL